MYARGWTISHRIWLAAVSASGLPLETARPQLLVVDDQQFFAGFLQEKLQERGYCVATAKDAPTALALVLQGSAPLVVLLDLMLPGVSGLQFLRELSRTARAPLTRVVLVSAHHTVEAAAAAHPLVIGRMQKPVDLGELARLVGTAVADLREG